MPSSSSSSSSSEPSSKKRKTENIADHSRATEPVEETEEVINEEFDDNRNPEIEQEIRDLKAEIRSLTVERDALPAGDSMRRDLLLAITENKKMINLNLIRSQQGKVI